MSTVNVRKPDVRFSAFSDLVRFPNVRFSDVRLKTGRLYPVFGRPVPMYIILQTGRYRRYRTGRPITGRYIRFSDVLYIYITSGSI